MKQKIKNKVTLINIISSLILQLVTIISGFIIPYLILQTFGSSVNGLVSSLLQFLSYISLVEGGVTSVITATLYKPLVNKDYYIVSSIINTTRSFYKKIAYIFMIYSLIISVLYPLLIQTNFSFNYVFSLTIILSINLFIQYMFSLTYKTLLNADKKVYIVSITQIIIIISNIFLTYLSIKVFNSIHILKLLSGMMFILQPIVYGLYVKKNYNLEKNAPIDTNLLKNRWNGFAINIASIIHFSTDVTILTLFTNLKVVSVYSVYSLVTTGLRTIINSISTGINPTIGQNIASKDEIIIKKNTDNYEFIIVFLVFLIFTIATLLITPFVMLYTKSVVDVNYYQPLFGYLLLISEAIYLLRLPHLNIAYSANKFKKITKPAFIETILNILISIVLVKKYGLIGITIGTIIAMLYRTVFHVKFTKTIIKNYSQWDFYKKILVYTACSIIGIVVSKFAFAPIKTTLYSWITSGIYYSFTLLVIFIVGSLLFYKKQIKDLVRYLKIK